MRKGQCLLLADRFWPKVKGRGTDGCWFWTGKQVGRGYGQIRYQRDGIWSHATAHRVSWELHNGPIPAGLMVCHKCDMPPCVNPNHLFLGTAKDNIDDRTAKGRDLTPARRGDLHCNSKLGENTVFRVKIIGDSLPQTVIAQILKVHKVTVHDILGGRTWNYLQRKAT
jgi:hypothetical protein